MFAMRCSANAAIVIEPLSREGAASCRRQRRKAEDLRLWRIGHILSLTREAM